jgi:hypothetical protein
MTRKSFKTKEQYPESSALEVMPLLQVIILIRIGY